MNLRVPGPTPCPEDILLAGAQPMINHRGPEFADLISRIHLGLQTIFQTSNDIAILTASGTAAMEAAIVNTLSPGDTVLGITIGVFGERFLQIAETYGVTVIKLEFPYGTVADPGDIEKALDANKEISAVLVTHNETSTGVTNDIQSIASIVKNREKLLLVDAISSLGCIRLDTDDWNCDVVVTGSQKGFMVPPGLAFAAISSEAWTANARAKLPRFYLDFARHIDQFKNGQTPWTPAVSLMFSLDLALKKMLEQGIASIFQQHSYMSQKVRDGIKALGLELFAQDEKYASNTVTAVKVPEGVDSKKFLGLLRTEHEVILAGGQASLSGKIFRIGHLGYIRESDITEVLEAIHRVLPQAGFKG